MNDTTDPFSFEGVAAVGVEAHQMELDHQQIRDEEILKLLEIYNDGLSDYLNNHFSEAMGRTMDPAILRAICSIHAQECIRDKEFSHIKL